MNFECDKFFSRNDYMFSHSQSYENYEKKQYFVIMTMFFS